MVYDEEFCSNCEIQLPKHLITKKPMGHRFKQGFFCQKCAEIKVNKARNR